MPEEKEFSLHDTTLLTITWTNNQLLVKVLLRWVGLTLDIASETFGK